MRRNKGVLKITLMAVLIGLLSFGTTIYSNVFSIPSFAMVQQYSSFDAIKTGLDGADNVEKAIAVIEKSKLNKLTDENIYDLLTITYSEPRWLTPVNGKTIERLQLLIAKNGDWIGRFAVEKKGEDLITHKEIAYLSYIWPPDNGFVTGTERALVLKEGDLIDRYGKPWGAYLSPEKEGDIYTIKERALKPGADITSTYHVYEVKKDFIVQVGLIQPWFGVEGNGVQYYTGVIKVQDYLDNDFLEEVDPSTLN